MPSQYPVLTPIDAPKMIPPTKSRTSLQSSNFDGINTYRVPSLEVGQWIDMHAACSVADKMLSLVRSKGGDAISWTLWGAEGPSAGDTDGIACFVRALQPTPTSWEAELEWLRFPSRPQG